MTKSKIIVNSQTSKQFSSIGGKMPKVVDEYNCLGHLIGRIIDNEKEAREKIRSALMSEVETRHCLS